MPRGKIVKLEGAMKRKKRRCAPSIACFSTLLFRLADFTYPWVMEQAESCSSRHVDAHTSIRKDLLVRLFIFVIKLHSRFSLVFDNRNKVLVWTRLGNFDGFGNMGFLTGGFEFGDFWGRT